MRDCDACVVVVEGFSNAKVANRVLTTSVQQHVCALDVTVYSTHLRVQAGQTVQRQTAQQSARRPSAAPGTAASVRQTILQATTLHQGVH
jgi:hypothetical protein